MDVVTCSRARESLQQLMEQVCSDHRPLTIEGNGGRSVVLISFDDYRSLDESLYLLSSPQNASRLLDSVDELDKTN